MLKDPRTEKLFDICDRGNNFPLHVAAKKGYLSIVMDLIKVVSFHSFDLSFRIGIITFWILNFAMLIFFKLQAGSEVDKKNEDEQTPLHLAAKEGRIM